jgi:hypothetical protein
MRRQRRASAPAARASAPAVPDPAVVPGAGEAPGPGADAARDGPVVSIDDARRAIAAKDASTEYRFGSHDAVIEDFRLLDAQGHPCQALRVGERFTVELDVAVLAPLSDLAAAIMFRNAQGQNLFGANTRYDGPVPIGPLVAGARFRISIGMEMLLNPGEYLLHLGLAECRSDHVYVSLDNRDKVGVVTVHGKPVSYGLVHHCPDFSVAPLGTSGTGRSLAGMRS